MRRRAFAVAAIVPALLLALALGVRATHGEVLPGVRVEGVELGGATRAEVRERLAPVVDASRGDAADARRRGPARDDRARATRATSPISTRPPTARSRPAAAGRSAGWWSTVAGLLSSRATCRSPRPSTAASSSARSRRSPGRLGRDAFPGELVIEPGTLAITHEGAALRARGRPARARRSGCAQALDAPPARDACRCRCARSASRRRAAVDAVGRAARALPRRSRCGSPAPASRSTISPGRLAGVLALESRDGGAQRAARRGRRAARGARRRDRGQARPARAQRADQRARLGRQARREGRRVVAPARGRRSRVTAPARAGRTVKRDAARRARSRRRSAQAATTCRRADAARRAGDVRATTRATCARSSGRSRRTTSPASRA